MNYTVYQSPLGPLLIAGDSEALRHIRFAKDGKAARPERGWVESCTGPVAQAVTQLREYFAGRRTEFDLPLAMDGTAFQQSVWRALQEIPYGETISYGELARRVGKPKAFRAAGSANGKNCLSIVIPCHRVIAAGGKLGGFGANLHLKVALLNLEQSMLQQSASAQKASLTSAGRLARSAFQAGNRA